MKASTSLKLGGALLLAGLLGTGLWHLHGADSDTTSVSSGTAAPELAKVLNAPAAAITFSTGLEHLPQSLQGTDPPPGLIIDSNGNLVITHKLREFFDYFLSALGEESLATIRARVSTYMGKSLPARADASAEQIFAGYLNYRQALLAVPQTGGKPAEQLDLDAVARQKTAERALRTQYLSPEVITAFFGDEDAYDNYTLARLAIERNKNLSAAEKKAQIQAQFAQLPPDTQASLQSMEKLQDVEQLNNTCQQQHCSPEQLHQMRSDLVGPEAADRLDALDVQRAAWSSRVDTYLNQRAAILANASFSDSDKQAQIEQLRQSGFSAQEQLRLSAFEMMRDKGAQAN